MTKLTRKDLGPVTVEVTPDKFSIDPRVSITGKFLSKTNAQAPLAEAIMSCRPGSDPVIEIAGRIPNRLLLGGGSNVNAKELAHWGLTPMRLAIIGKPGTNATMQGTQIRSRLQGVETGGVSDLWMEGISFEPRWGSSSCILIFKYETMGKLWLFDSNFRPDPTDPDAYGGYGYKFGIRAEGRAQYEIARATFAPVQEHCLYLDSPQGESSFRNIVHNGSTRTAIQIVNRPVDNPGPSGFGDLIIEDINGRELWGSGGSLVTVAGHLGDILIRRVKLAQGSKPGCHGAVVVWTNTAPEHGAYLTKGRGSLLHSAGHVLIDEIDIDAPDMDRAGIAVSGARRLGVQSFRFATAMKYEQLALDTPFSKTRFDDEDANIDGQTVRVTGDCINGRTRIEPSGFGSQIEYYQGWGPSGMRVSQGGKRLSVDEIKERFGVDQDKAQEQRSIKDQQVRDIDAGLGQ